MENIHAKHTHFLIRVELRFLGIQTRWVPRDESGRRYLVPLVTQRLDRKNEHIADPDAIRKRFFKMKDSETSALEFLNSVGAWSIEESGDIAVWSDGTLRKGRVVVGEKSSYIAGAFGHRFIQNGRALPWDVKSLCRERDRWRDLMQSNYAKFRKLFGPLSGSSIEDRYIFALNTKWFGNSLRVHLEWQGKHARAVIQPITGKELLMALAWLDVVTGAKVKICEKCHNEYTRGGRKFCTLQCEHANTMSTYRISYTPLRTWLEPQPAQARSIPATFEQIERIIGHTLPPTARRRAQWWENNATGHPHARAWLDAGYLTEQVSIPNETLTFRRKN